MASIRKIKNKWQARVRIKGHSTYCKSSSQKSDALSWSKTVEVGLQNGSYLISRNGIYYYSHPVPADLHKLFNKNRVIKSLRTKSRNKALRLAQMLSDRLEDYL